MDSIRRPAWQEVLPLVVCCRQLVAGRCKCLVDCDLDAGELRGGHADEVEEVEGRVDEGDVEVWGALEGCCFSRGMFTCRCPSPLLLLARRQMLPLRLAGRDWGRI